MSKLWISRRIYWVIGNLRKSSEQQLRLEYLFPRTGVNGRVLLYMPHILLFSSEVSSVEVALLVLLGVFIYDSLLNHFNCNSTCVIICIVCKL